MGIYVGNKRYALFVGSTRRKVAEKGLPYDAEIEYLETSGTQWINTNYYPNTNTVIETTVRFLDRNIGYLLGSNYSNSGGQDNFYFQLYNNIIWAGAGNAQSNNLGNVSVDNTTNYDITLKGEGYLKVNNTTKSRASGGVLCNDPMYIFTRNNLASIGQQSFRLFSFKISENNVTMMDFIPVRKGTIGYMYDKVSGTLFGNSGTGNFTLGPDKN